MSDHSQAQLRFESALSNMHESIRLEVIRERLRKKIVEQDAVRGRPLTDQERLGNLKRWLDADEATISGAPKT